MNLQVTVHDWKAPGTIVWTKTQGHLCPPLEDPMPGEAVVFVDYEKDESEQLVQIDVELAIDALGYPSGPRYVGKSPLDEDANVVSYVGTFLCEQIAQHLSVLSEVVPVGVLCVSTEKSHDFNESKG